METMTKKRTSLNIDDQTWKDWTMYVHQKTGSTYKVSEVSAEAFKEYMRNHPIEG